jgi:trehalose 6-phosphate phosphatase
MGECPNQEETKTLDRLLSVWQHEASIRARLEGKRLAVFLDYDGTLSPIVDDPANANLSNDMRAAVAALARTATVAIVSGRDLQDLRRRVGLDGVFLAGSHGFDIAGPEGWQHTLQKGSEFLSDLDDAERRLRERLAQIEGALVERKRFSIAVHYRCVRDRDVKHVEEVVDRVLDAQPRLHKGEGKKVFRLQPRIDWDKGHAVDWLLEQLELDRPDILPLYIGDDVTDEDAFRALAGRGLTIAVRDGDCRPTAAQFALADPDDVRRFLEWLRDVTEHPGAP